MLHILLARVWDRFTVEAIEDSADALSNSAFPLDKFLVISLPAVSDRS